MLNFAVEHDWIDANPAALIKKPGEEDVTRARADRRRDPTRSGDCPRACRPPKRSRRLDGRARKGTKDDPHLPRQRGARRDSEAPAPDSAARRRSGPDAVERPGPRDRLVDDSRDPRQESAGRTVCPLTDRPSRDHPGAAAGRAGGPVFSEAGSARDRAKKAPTAVGTRARHRGLPGPRSAAHRGDAHGEAGVPRQHIAYVLNHARRHAARDPGLRPIRARHGEARRARGMGADAS